MAISYGFYNSLLDAQGKPDRVYDAEDIGKIFDGVILDGIYAQVGNKFMIRPIEGTMGVNVDSGRGWFNHTWTYNDGLTQIKEIYDYEGNELDEMDRHVTYKTIYSAVLEINRSLDYRKNTIKLIGGTPASNPIPPTLIEGDGEIWQYRIANITVGNSSEMTEIKESDIEYVVGTTKSNCKYVTGPLETIPANNYFIQWASEFEQWLEDKEEQFTTWSENRKAEFDEWFSKLEDDLTSDQAANLWLYITQVNNLLKDNLNVKVDRFDDETGELYLKSINLEV